MKKVHAEDSFLLGLLLSCYQSSNGWDVFLNRWLEHFNLHSVHLYAIGTKQQLMKFHIQAGQPLTDQFANLFLEKFIADSPFIKMAVTAKDNLFYSANLSEFSDEIYNSNFYSEWMSPQNIEDYALSCLSIDEDWVCIMVNNRSKEQGLISSSDIERFNGLVPFISKVYQLSIKMQNTSSMVERTHAITNSFRIPVAVYSEFGNLISCNQQMDNLFKNQDGPALSDKVDVDQTGSTKKLLTHGVLQSIINKSGLQITDKYLSVKSLDKDFKLHFHELYSDVENHGRKNLGVMVYVINPEYTIPHSIEVLRSMLPFTQVEAEVCQALLKGYGLNEISEIYHKSINTVKEQVKNCYRKAGCKSQLDLINLLSSLPMTNVNFD